MIKIKSIIQCSLSTLLLFSISGVLFSCSSTDDVPVNVNVELAQEIISNSNISQQVTENTPLAQNELSGEQVTSSDVSEDYPNKEDNTSSKHNIDNIDENTNKSHEDSVNSNSHLDSVYQSSLMELSNMNDNTNDNKENTNISVNKPKTNRNIVVLQNDNIHSSEPSNVVDEPEEEQNTNIILPIEEKKDLLLSEIDKNKEEDFSNSLNTNLPIEHNDNEKHSTINTYAQLEGSWVQMGINGDGDYMVATIRNETICVSWVIDGKQEIYWAGSYEEPNLNDEYPHWVSKRLESIPVSSPRCLSKEKTKEFTYSEGLIYFNATYLDGTNVLIMLQQEKYKPTL